MDRRVSGGLILVMALLVALVVPTVLHPPRLDGFALIAPAPPPPSVGDCLRESVSGYTLSDTGELTTYGPTTVVPCTEPHRAEVIRVGDAPGPAPSLADMTQLIDAFAHRCFAESADLWGTAGGARTDDWQPAVNFSSGVFGPDGRQAAAGQHWAACAVGLADGELQQSIAELSRDDRIPAELGSCAVAVDDPAGSEIGISCTSPHTSEDFANRMLDAGSAITQDDLDRSCRELVAAAVGRPDIATETALVIRALAYAWSGSDTTTDTVPQSQSPFAAGGWATCSVRTTDDRTLTASLRELGSGPLPWAP